MTRGSACPKRCRCASAAISDAHQVQAVLARHARASERRDHDRPRQAPGDAGNSRTMRALSRGRGGREATTAAADEPVLQLSRARRTVVTGAVHAVPSSPKRCGAPCPRPSSSTIRRSCVITARVMAERQQAQLCQSCHTQAQCQSCHDVTQDLTVEKRRPEQIESGQVHRGDFMVRHAIEARSQPARCLSCHTVQTCDACHVARGVSANVANPANPHPPEWIGSNTSSSNFHGTVGAARHRGLRGLPRGRARHQLHPLPQGRRLRWQPPPARLEERARRRCGNVQVLP